MALENLITLRRYSMCWLLQAYCQEMFLMDSVLSSAFFMCRLASRAAFSRQVTKQHPTRAATNIFMADVKWAAVYVNCKLSVTDS